MVSSEIRLAQKTCVAPTDNPIGSDSGRTGTRPTGNSNLHYALTQARRQPSGQYTRYGGGAATLIIAISVVALRYKHQGRITKQRRAVGGCGSV